MSEQKSSAAVDVSERGLKKHDIKVSTVVFMVFCLVAAGCYGIEEMIPASGPGLTIIMLCALPFVWGLPFGLVASELGSVRPQEGGYYKWVQEALGEFWGFQAGWWRTISIYIDNTLYVILAGGYVASHWNLSPVVEFIIKALMILIFTYINIRGVKDVGTVSTILGIVVIGAFAMVAICGFMNLSGEGIGPLTPEGSSGIALKDWCTYIGGGIAVGMWMYSGYESMSTIAGEIENPQVIPKATMITIPLIMLVYILPTWAGLASMGRWDEWGTEVGTVGYADVVTTFWGSAFGVVFILVAVLAQCSIYNTYIASGSRGFFALADDYLAPPVLVKCDKKHGVPYVAVLTVAIVNLILCNFAFSAVVIVDVFLLVSAYAMIYISALILRKKIPSEEYKFKIPGGFGFLCVLCIVPLIIIVALFYLSGTDYFIGGMIGIVSGPVLYIIWKRMYGGLAKKDPVAFPINERTKLAVGDLKRIAGLLIGLAAIGGVGVPWLKWFEGDWANEYYGVEVYSEGILKGFLGNFDTMITVIAVFAMICFVVGVVLAIVSLKLEPKKESIIR